MPQTRPGDPMLISEDLQQKVLTFCQVHRVRSPLWMRCFWGPVVDGPPNTQKLWKAVEESSI
eukprot:4997214-Alexandrium_andersonii.AAC.1